MSNSKIEKILENHQHWLKRDCKEWKLMKADLFGANLRDVNLSGANLRSANLRSAYLFGANLCDANLRGTNLREADLREANLFGADLRGTNLREADLREANLFGADLREADLFGANLCDANLSGANLREADLREADLFGANLRGTNLCECEEIRKGIKLSSAIIGWKKCKDGVIVELEIPRGAIVFSINNSNCRTDKAIVKKIYGSDRAYSIRNYISYYVGDKIEVFNFNCEYNVECAEGIHFFRTREEAERY